MYKPSEQDKRIEEILGRENIPVSEKSLKKYLKYLKQNLDLPCQFTGIEDFDWEEYYIFGPGSEKEYERLKKIRPSYEDIFKMISFEDDFDEDYGISVKVQRISDKKRFTISLADLEATDKKSRSYQLLHDYSVWFVNNR